MRYDTGQLLGAGAMGEVVRAHDPTLNRDVALKFLRSADPSLLQRFQREAQAQARVDHPGVCRVYEVGEMEGRAFIAMQLVDGPTLGRLAPTVPVEERVRLVRDVAEAVHAAHETGLIHRDLKPGNILVEARGGPWRAYVADFGLARDLAEPGLTETGTTVGTPAYMSPEQARGDRNIDRRTDVYSLGAVLFEVLTGVPPFDSVSPVQILLQVLQDEAPGIRSLDRTLPQDLETIVATCLEKDPHRRYPTARALAEDLTRFLAGDMVLARPLSRAARLARRVRRSPRSFALGAVAVVAVLVLAGLALRQRLEEAAAAAAGQRFGQEVERIDAVLREARLLPRHDLTAAKRDVRSRMDAIAAQLPSLTASRAAWAHYALGRGHLALGKLEPARGELQAATDLGLQSPELDLAFGRTLAASTCVPGRTPSGTAARAPSPRGCASRPTRPCATRRCACCGVPPPRSGTRPLSSRRPRRWPRGGGRMPGPSPGVRWTPGPARSRRRA